MKSKKMIIRKNFTLGYCPVCNMVVARGDPEKVQWNGNFYHRHCFLKLQNSINYHNKNP